MFGHVGDFLYLCGMNNVDHPMHYNGHPSGVECIDIVRHYNFDIGCAIKYLWRAGLKTEEGMDNLQKEVEDLKKAIWYINDHIETIDPEHKYHEQ